MDVVDVLELSKIGLYIAGFILAIAGFVMAINKRKKAPQKLKMAREAFSSNNHLKGLALLNEAFLVWEDEKYNPNEALINLEVIELLEEFLAAREVTNGFLTDEVKNAFKAAVNGGGRVTLPLTRQVLKFLEAASKGTEGEVELLVKSLEDRSFFNQFKNERLSDVKIRVESFILENEIPKAIKAVNSELAFLGEKYKSDLLELRAKCFFKQGKYDKALCDYLDSLEINPGSCRIHLRLAQTYHKMGNGAQTQMHARIVLDNTKEKEYIKIARKLV